MVWKGGPVAPGCQCFARGLSKCFCPPPPVAKPASPAQQKAYEELDAVGQAQARAKAVRDQRKAAGQEPLVDQWREVCKPRKGGAIPPKPPGCKVDFPGLFALWLQQRGLDTALERVEDEKGWAIFKYVKKHVVESRKNWEQGFHGTWWYAVWSLLESGVFLESNDRSLGHDFWEPGVYCSPNLDTGLWYARPQILFGDGVYHRIILEVRVDPQRRKVNRKRGGVQWVFPSAAVALHAIWVRTNAPPSNGEERINNWDPLLEAVPLGYQVQPAIVNPRKDPWPPMLEEFPFTAEWASDAPPWLQSGRKDTTAGQAAVAAKSSGVSQATMFAAAGLQQNVGWPLSTQVPGLPGATNVGANPFAALFTGMGGASNPWSGLLATATPQSGGPKTPGLVNPGAAPPPGSLSFLLNQSSASSPTSGAATGPKPVGPVPATTLEALLGNREADGQPKAKKQCVLDKKAHPAVLHLIGCSIRPELDGPYTISDAYNNFLGHDRPTYQKAPNGPFCYFWSTSSGSNPELHTPGWYISKAVGDPIVLGRCDDDVSVGPPCLGWMIQPLHPPGSDLVACACGFVPP